MYNPQLETFIIVADVGSFNKASEILFVSPNAVMKQINLLEDTLGFRSFYRTHRGLTLTPSGESLYHDAKYIIQYSKEAISRAAHKIDNQQMIRIGVSFTTPVEYLLSLWNQVHQLYPQLKFELVSFENTPDNAREIMKNFGKKIDLVAGIYSPNLLRERKCQATYLYDTPICCAVPKNHVLANRSKLEIEDLYGQTLLILEKYYLDHFDRIRADILQKHTDIKIADVPFFNMDVFNQCVNENKIMLAIEEWKNIHPMLKIIPVQWHYSIPFGIMYSPNCNHDVKLFIEAVQKLYQ